MNDSAKNKVRTVISISEIAKRSGVSASALRYYEDMGLIFSIREPGKRRQFDRSTLRRVAFIGVAQSIGLTLEQIKESMAALPAHSAPNKKQWEKLARAWEPQLQSRINALETMRQRLKQCIGCGCLSLTACHLYNRNDRIGATGVGPRYLLGVSVAT
jgi:MerR family transcriptional regulator, redox-sensitive transcriptional activator SoxR